MDDRIGIGYDIHRLQEGRKLILGGIEIPHDKGLLGHSDADVLIHAICDALLGAMGQGDIGEHFPDTDPRYKDISSIILLENLKEMMQSQGFGIAHMDTVILAEHPKLQPYKEDIREKIAQTLSIDIRKINIKATTQEGIGFGAAGPDAVAAYAIALLKPTQERS